MFQTTPNRKRIRQVIIYAEFAVRLI